MSLNSLASSRVSREVATARRARGPQAGAQGGVGMEAGPAVLASGGDDALGPDPQDVQNALSALVEYVPAETITLYLATIATLAALPADSTVLTSFGPRRAYWLFALVTPVLYALIYAGKRNAAHQPRWPGLKQWPWWPTIAATVAFLAWGLTVPDAPYLTGDAQIFRGLVAIAVSTLLGVGGRFFAQPTT